MLPAQQENDLRAVKPAVMLGCDFHKQVVQTIAGGKGLNSK